jgi:hypothetical protein
MFDYFTSPHGPQPQPPQQQQEELQSEPGSSNSSNSSNSSATTTHTDRSVNNSTVPAAAAAVAAADGRDLRRPLPTLQPSVNPHNPHNPQGNLTNNNAGGVPANNALDVFGFFGGLFGVNNATSNSNHSPLHRNPGNRRPGAAGAPANTGFFGGSANDNDPYKNGGTIVVDGTVAPEATTAIDVAPFDVSSE